MGTSAWPPLCKHKTANYDGDLMQHLIKLGEKISGKTYDADDSGASRSCVSSPTNSRAVDFMISDGILPGNEGREYVLRPSAPPCRVPRSPAGHRGCLPDPSSSTRSMLRWERLYPELLKNVALVKGIVASGGALLHDARQRPRLSGRGPGSAFRGRRASGRCRL